MARLGPYAPRFVLRIDGEPLPTAMLGSVVSVKLQNGLEGADRVELVVANPGYQFLDHPQLQLDKPLSLAIGYAPDPLEDMFFGEITGVEPTFPNSGIPTIAIAAQDRLHRLARGKKDDSFAKSIPMVGNFPTPDMAVLAELARGLRPGIDPVGGALSLLTMLASYLAAPDIAQKGVRTQENASNYEMLKKIAKDNGWEMFIDHTSAGEGKVLRFKSIVSDFAPVATLKRGVSLIDFTPRHTSIGDVAAVTARVWVDFLKMEFVLVLGWNDERSTFDFKILPGQKGDVAGAVGGQAAESSVDIKPASFALAPQKMFSEILPRLNNRLTGSASTTGNPLIRASRVVRIEGVGAQFGGLYRVTAATHTLDSGGYKTTFEMRKEVWFGAIPAPKGVSLRSPLLGQDAA